MAVNRVRPQGPALLLAFLWAGSAVADPAPLRLESRLDGGPWWSAPSVHALAGQEVELRVSGEPPGEVRWFEILPDLSRDYHNAQWPWLPGAYRWLGHEKIHYVRREVESLRGRRSVALAGLLGGELPPEADGGRPQYRRRDAGSFWFQAAVDEGSQVRRSPGLEGRDHRGLSPEVLRVSVREAEGYLGWLSTYFNVPAVFGSTPYQTRNYLGVDCADVVMAALAAWRGVKLERDWNVAALVGAITRVAGFDLVGGQPSRPVRWNAEARPGDLIAVRYFGGRFSQHVGALARDADGDGLLGPDDEVLHAGPSPLHRSRLGSGAFDGHAVVLRPEGPR